MNMNFCYLIIRPIVAEQCTCSTPAWRNCSTRERGPRVTLSIPFAHLLSLTFPLLSIALPLSILVYLFAFSSTDSLLSTTVCSVCKDVLKDFFKIK
jgi:hypothetical protein